VTPETWLAYVGVTLVVLAIPGPTILLVLSYSITHGRPAALPLVAGVALGDSVAITLSLIGLGGLLAASALWFTVIKWIGGLYLIWLGARLLFGRGRVSGLASTPAAGSSPARLFGNAFIVTALNPKSIVFFIALLPQFLDTGRPLAAQLVLLGVTFVVLAAFAATGYALFAAVIRRFLQSPRAQRGYALAGGGLLCAAGIWALGAQRMAR